MSKLKVLMARVASYFEAPIEGGFKTAADGRRLFYPWGVLGKGYVLPDARTEQRIRRFVKIYNMVSLALVLIGVITASVYGFDYAYALALLAVVMLVVYGVYVRSLKRRLFATRERLRLSESLANSWMARSPRAFRAMLWFLFILFIGFVIGGIGLILDRQVVMGLLNILIFGAFATTSGYTLLRTRA